MFKEARYVQTSRPFSGTVKRWNLPSITSLINETEEDERSNLLSSLFYSGCLMESII
jgi:hypothetical protein